MTNRLELFAANGKDDATLSQRDAEWKASCTLMTQRALAKLSEETGANV
jgi:hypothetical protein